MGGHGARLAQASNLTVSPARPPVPLMRAQIIAIAGILCGTTALLLPPAHLPDGPTRLFGLGTLALSTLLALRATRIATRVDTPSDAP